MTKILSIFIWTSIICIIIFIFSWSSNANYMRIKKNNLEPITQKTNKLQPITQKPNKLQPKQQKVKPKPKLNTDPIFLKNNLDALNNLAKNDEQIVYIHDKHIYDISVDFLFSNGNTYTRSFIQYCESFLKYFSNPLFRQIKSIFESRIKKLEILDISVGLIDFMNIIANKDNSGSFVYQTADGRTNTKIIVKTKIKPNISSIDDLLNFIIDLGVSELRICKNENNDFIYWIHLCKLIAENPSLQNYDFMDIQISELFPKESNIYRDLHSLSAKNIFYGWNSAKNDMGNDLTFPNRMREYVKSYFKLQKIFLQDDQKIEYNDPDLEEVYFEKFDLKLPILKQPIFQCQNNSKEFSFRDICVLFLQNMDPTSNTLFLDNSSVFSNLFLEISNDLLDASCKKLNQFVSVLYQINEKIKEFNITDISLLLVNIAMIKLKFIPRDHPEVVYNWITVAFDISTYDLQNVQTIDGIISEYQNHFPSLSKEDKVLLKKWLTYMQFRFPLAQISNLVVQYHLTYK